LEDAVKFHVKFGICFVYFSPHSTYETSFPSNYSRKSMCYYSGQFYPEKVMFLLQGVSGRCEQTLGNISIYQNAKYVHINMCPEAFDLRVTAEREPLK
jgi:hypothetical protein